MASSLSRSYSRAFRILSMTMSSRTGKRKEGISSEKEPLFPLLERESLLPCRRRHAGRQICRWLRSKLANKEKASPWTHVTVLSSWRPDATMIPEYSYINKLVRPLWFLLLFLSRSIALPYGREYYVLRVAADLWDEMRWEYCVRTDRWCEVPSKRFFQHVASRRGRGWSTDSGIVKVQ
jgi:hypothetical protein